MIELLREIVCAEYWKGMKRYGLYRGITRFKNVWKEGEGGGAA